MDSTIRIVWIVRMSKTDSTIGTNAFKILPFDVKSMPVTLDEARPFWPVETDSVFVGGAIVSMNADACSQANRLRRISP